MESLRELYRIGVGPSSSHTMGPRMAAERFLEKHSDAPRFRVTLFESLAATGKGHLTDWAILSVLGDDKTELIWKAEEKMPEHPNGMQFEALDSSGAVIDIWKVYSVGGGAIREEGAASSCADPVYGLTTITEIMAHCEDKGITYWEYVDQCEGLIFGIFCEEFGK